MLLPHKNKIIIAHRGACGYLPEHTLVAKALAYGMGADYLEQDIALSKDNRAIVIHDCHLDTVTNVKDIFPNRAREDGRYYVIDFTLDEIKQLVVNERVHEKNWKVVFKKRFPFSYHHKTHLKLHLSTLEEEIELIQGMNKSTGRNVGIYPELKKPQFHKQEGKNIAKIVIDILYDYGYKKIDSRCYVQCFDPETLVHLRKDLKTKLKLVQLIAPDNWKETPGVEYRKMLTIQGIEEIAEYANGIGPYIDQLVTHQGKDKHQRFTGVTKIAHANNLVVHPYTFRADKLPPYARSFEHLLYIFFNKVGIDGVFTDFPDRVAHFLHEGLLPWDSNPDLHSARSFFKKKKP